MKKFWIALAALALSAAAASAQDYNAAIDSFNAGAQALEVNKVEALAQFRSALAQFEACQEEEAAEMIAKCKEIIPSTLLSIAKEQINDADYDAALITLDQTAATAKEYGAEAVAADAAELVTNTYLRKGSSLLKEKDFAGAAAALQEVVGREPGNGQAQLLLGQALLQDGKLEDATLALESANALGKTQALKLLSNAYLKQGQSLLKAGKLDECVASLEKSNSYIPSANAFKLMASAFTKGNKSAQAIDAYKKYLEVDPNAKDAPDILFTIAATAQNAGYKATAIEYYEKLAGNAKYGAQAAAQLKSLK